MFNGDQDLVIHAIMDTHSNIHALFMDLHGYGLLI